MITIFCDFRQVWAKELAFFSKTNVMMKFLQKLSVYSFCKKTAIFPNFFGENIVKILSSVSDRVAIWQPSKIYPNFGVPCNEKTWYINGHLENITAIWNIW
jgi:hypothetical protein